MAPGLFLELLHLHPPPSDSGRGRRLLLLVLLGALGLGSTAELLSTVLPLLACSVGGDMLAPLFQCSP